MAKVNGFHGTHNGLMGVMGVMGVKWGFFDRACCVCEKCEEKKGHTRAHLSLSLFDDSLTRSDALTVGRNRCPAACRSPFPKTIGQPVFSLAVATQ